MKATTGFVYHPKYQRHETGYHPECAARLSAIVGGLEETGLSARLAHISPVSASNEQLMLVHTRAYISQVEAMSARGGGMLDPDTPVSRESFEVALLAAGGVLNAVDAIMDESTELKHVFALVRPPGHHANATRGRGFCIFNNVAIAAAYARQRYRLNRVLIVDWDVHHGNGTQEIFVADPSVLYFSTHQYPHYPGTGWLDEVGSGDGAGYTVNVPLPSGADDRDYLYALRSILVPIALQFQPELVLVSAGFDAHAADPLASMAVSADGFGLFTEVVMAVAAASCGGRIVLTLEGGYNLDALTDSVRAVFNALVTGRCELTEAPGSSSSSTVRERVRAVAEVQRAYWEL
jgi:acetoin utilization deacetylase AcuC-like enzyme